MGAARRSGWAGVESYSTRHEDTLLDLAVNNNLGFIELVMANPSVDPWLPGEGTEIVLPKLHLPPDGPSHGIVLNLPEQRCTSTRTVGCSAPFRSGSAGRPCHPDRQNLDRPKAGESDLVSDSLGAE